MRELFQKEVEILFQAQLGPEYFKMGLAFPEIAQVARPGQFVMVRLPDREIPLLRRPFSVHGLLGDDGHVSGFELLYKVVGQGTRGMAEKKIGDSLDVLGPLGNGFSLPEGAGHVFLVAGGVGVASLHYLGVALSKRSDVEMTVFLGGCSAADILCQEAFKAMGAQVLITTEDCTLGEKGLVTLEVEKSLKGGEKPALMYACGPTAMLETLSHMSRDHGVPCQISLETAMACGFGVCLGCAVDKADRPGTYLHACTDGPVFDSRAVLLDSPFTK